MISPKLTPEEMQEIESKVLAKTGSFRKTGRILREEIFSILEDEATLLKYPIQDDELCAFVCKKQEHLFVYINTHIPLEKQIFAAAHELYHIWYDQEQLNEPQPLNINTIENNTEDIGELKANLFAAMLLVPKDILSNQLESLHTSKERLSVNDIVKLMAIFFVPYKTIVRRLYEIQYISEKQMTKLLDILDRDPNSGVLLQRKILQMNDTSQNRTGETAFEGLVEQALYAFEKKLIDAQKLSYLLSLIQQSPKHFGVHLNDEISDDEWESIMEDYNGND
jgi:Zn-dependent peptidase ImmA (M78 family)